MRVDYDKDQLAYALANALKERDEARDAFVIATDQMVQAQCKLRESNTERDEKNLRQTERIRYLEGATNHACGTPLSVALKERDEARNLACVYQHQYYIHVHPNTIPPYFSWQRRPEPM